MMNGTLNSRTKFTLGALALLMSLGSVPAMAQQQQRQQAAMQGMNALPPALQAAVMSGNANQIYAAIMTLSAGNPTQAANLASQVITAAERMLAVNPVAVASAASAALRVFSQPSVAEANPQAALQAATIAGRIMTNPTVMQVAPSVAASIAVAAAQLVANPTVYGANPQAAIQVAAQAHQTVTNQTVAAVSPQAARGVDSFLRQMLESPLHNALNSTNAADLRRILAIEDDYEHIFFGGDGWLGQDSTIPPIPTEGGGPISASAL